MKRCFKCGQVKPLSDFYKHKEMSDGHLNKCKCCAKKDTKDNYRAHIGQYKKYDKYRQRNSISRILSHRYNGIRQRCEGRATREYGVVGMEFLSKEEWDKWCENTMPEFMRLYEVWKSSGYKRKYCPSVDRKDNKKGYIVGNLQWLSLTDNSRKYNK